MKYNKPQRYILYNHGDPDLHPVVLRTPEPPEEKYIDGYGLKPIDQKFRYMEVPVKLLNLEETALSAVREWASKRFDRAVTEYRVLNEFWRILENDKSFYKEEIEFIKKIHFYLTYGYWVFIYGTPTWFPPTYFRYLNFWYYPDVDGYRPHYRAADREAYVFKWYCWTTKETLGNLSSDGTAQKDENGNYTVITKPFRTVFGHAKVKRRREGATNQECSDLLWRAENKKAGVFPIMAETGDGAIDLFKKYMSPGWEHQPMFLKPIAITNSKEIIFDSPKEEYKVEGIGSSIFPVTAANSKKLDKAKIHGGLFDEGAKNEEVDVYTRHNVIKPTAAQDTDIHGYMAYPTTVEEMEKGGGAYRDLWDDSDFYVRNVDGQTKTGLLRIFQPSYHGLDNHIDAWGNSVIETPTAEQIKYAPPKSAFIDGIGAKERLQTRYESLLADGSPKAMKNYREFIRKQPLYIADCWSGTAGDIGFNTVLLDQRAAELYRDKKLTKKGYFRWKKNIIDNPEGVEFVHDEENGRFVVSDLFIGRQNKMAYTRTASVWDEKQGGYVRAKMPLNTTVTTAGADPFDYGNNPNRSHSLKSDGGFYVMLNYDPIIDGGKDKEEWVTDTTLCTYRYSPPSLQEYCEDVIMACVYFGAMLVVERNKTRLWEHIIDRGYGGYLVYMVKPDGTIEKNPGVYTGQGRGDKDSYFNIARDYINDNILREKHLDLIKEMKEIQSPDKLRHYDLLTAFMIARVGAQYGYQRTLKRISNRAVYSLDGTSLARKKY